MSLLDSNTLNNEYIDITLTGPGGLQGLPSISLQNVDDYKKLLEDLKFSYYDNIVQLLINNNNAMSPLLEALQFQSLPVENIGARAYLGGYGDSKYDERITSINQLEDLEDFRALQQGWFAEVGNGLGKMATVAGTTFLSNTVGKILGLGEGIYNMFDSNPETTFRTALWKNDFQNAMLDILEAAEKAMPNYYSNWELSAPWYRLIFSGNSIGDKVLKNAGFVLGSAGAMLVGGAILKPLALLGKVGKGVAWLVNSYLGAAGEAGIEALLTYRQSDEAINLNTKAYEKSMINDLGIKRYLYLLEGYDLQSVDLWYNNELQNLNLNIKEYLQLQVKELNDASDGVYTANLIALMITNIINMGSFIKGGFKNASNFLDNVSITVGEKTGLFKNFTKEEIAQGIARGTIHASAREIEKAGLKIAGRWGLNTVSEAFQEGLQSEFSTTGLILALSRLNKFAYDNNISEAMMNPDATMDYITYATAAAKAYHDLFGTFSSPGWEEAFYGGLCGALGMPGFHRETVIDEAGNRKDKLKFHLSSAFMEAKNNIYDESYDNTVRFASALDLQLSDPKTLDNIKSAIASIAISDAKTRALNSNNIREYKNLQIAEAVSQALFFKRMGMYDLYLGAYEEWAKGLTDKDVEQLITATTDETLKSQLLLKSTDEIKKIYREYALSTVNKIKNIVSNGEQINKDLKDKYNPNYLTDIISDAIYRKSLLDDTIRRLDILNKEYEDLLELDNAVAELQRFEKFTGIKLLEKQKKTLELELDDIYNNPEKIKGKIDKMRKKHLAIRVANETNAALNAYELATTFNQIAEIYYKGDPKVRDLILDKAKLSNRNKALILKFSQFKEDVDLLYEEADRIVKSQFENDSENVEKEQSAVLELIDIFINEMIDDDNVDLNKRTLLSKINSKILQYKDELKDPMSGAYLIDENGEIRDIQDEEMVSSYVALINFLLKLSSYFEEIDKIRKAGNPTQKKTTDLKLDTTSKEDEEEIPELLSTDELVSEESFELPITPESAPIQPEDTPPSIWQKPVAPVLPQLPTASPIQELLPEQDDRISIKELVNKDGLKIEVRVVTTDSDIIGNLDSKGYSLLVKDINLEAGTSDAHNEIRSKVKPIAKKLADNELLLLLEVVDILQLNPNVALESPIFEMLRIGVKNYNINFDKKQLLEDLKNKEILDRLDRINKVNEAITLGTESVSFNKDTFIKNIPYDQQWSNEQFVNSLNNMLKLLEQTIRSLEFKVAQFQASANTELLFENFDKEDAISTGRLLEESKLKLQALRDYINIVNGKTATPPIITDDIEKQNDLQIPNTMKGNVFRVYKREKLQEGTLEEISSSKIDFLQLTLNFVDYVLKYVPKETKLYYIYDTHTDTLIEENADMTVGNDIVYLGIKVSDIDNIKDARMKGLVKNRIERYNITSVTTNNGEYYIIGTYGYFGKDREQLELFEHVVRSLRLSKDIDNFKGRYYVTANYTTKKSLTPGYFIRKQGANNSLKTLLESKETNPLGLKASNLRFSVIKGEENEPTTYHINFGSDSASAYDILNKKPGLAYVYIPTADGKWFPVYLEPIRFRDWIRDDTYKDTLLWRDIELAMKKAIDSQKQGLTDTSQSVKNFREFFEFGTGDFITFAKDNEIEFDLEKLLATTTDLFIKLKLFLKTVYKINLNSDEDALKVLQNAMDIIFQILSDVNPRIAVNINTLIQNPSSYIDSNVLLTDCQLLSMRGSEFSVNPCDNDLNMIVTDTVNRTQSDSTVTSAVPKGLRLNMEIDGNTVTFLYNQNTNEIFYFGLNTPISKSDKNYEQAMDLVELMTNRNNHFYIRLKDFKSKKPKYINYYVIGTGSSSRMYSSANDGYRFITGEDRAFIEKLKEKQDKEKRELEQKEKVEEQLNPETTTEQTTDNITELIINPDVNTLVSESDSTTEELSDITFLSDNKKDKEKAIKFIEDSPLYKRFIEELESSGEDISEDVDQMLSYVNDICIERVNITQNNLDDMTLIEKLYAIGQYCLSHNKTFTVFTGNDYNGELAQLLKC